MDTFKLLLLFGVKPGSLSLESAAQAFVLMSSQVHDVVLDLPASLLPATWRRLLRRSNVDELLEDPPAGREPCAGAISLWSPPCHILRNSSRSNGPRCLRWNSAPGPVRGAVMCRRAFFRFYYAGPSATSETCYSHRLRARRRLPSGGELETTPARGLSGLALIWPKTADIMVMPGE